LRVARSLGAMTTLIVAIVAAVGSPHGAEAAATRILGSSLPPTSVGLSCSCTFVQAAGASPGEGFVSPVDGVITRWRVRGAFYGPGADESLGLALRVLRPDGAFSYTGTGTSALGRPRTREIETFPTHLPIRAGEYVGIDVPEHLYLGYQPTPGALIGAIQPPIGDGATASATISESPIALTFNADVLPTPTIALLSPAGGTAPDQTTIGILGTGFEEVEAVAIGGSPAASYAVRSESLITAVIPAGLSPGRPAVTVTTPAGTASSTFDYTAPVSPPASGPGPVPTAKACIVPPLRGKKLKASKQRVRAAGCKFGKLTKHRGATARIGRVVKQSPKPGILVPAGTKVKVTLGRG
jgi:hypothetical protein